ncbi:MAG: NAD-dependent epimerase/dehydratase family protein [Proteobacteria bacterium]|nr:MAG: NAD-dependent epimerase/dehydratase family protein [Pseudomonadota bacterium]
MTNSQKTILMTGVTGFLGSYLAAAFMRQGFKVISLTRNDPQGERTIDAINTALHQDESGIEINFAKQLIVLPYDFAEVALHHRDLLHTVNEVWHCAAEMSFSPRKLESSFHSNVGMTSDLYSIVGEMSPDCQRFFYVSTAYTGGAEPGLKKEVLHTHPQLINPYQVTKWSTEMSLATQVMQGSQLPVTLFRPAVVIGDTRTGYYPGSPFGIYMYFQALKSAKALGAEKLTIDLNLDSSLQMVPIEVLIGNAMALSARVSAGTACDPLEIFHITGQPVSNSLCLKVAKKIMNLEVNIGEPETTLDFFADKICGWVKRFGNGHITFDDSKLQDVLGEAYVPTNMGEDEFRTLFTWYNEHLNEQQKKKSNGPSMKQSMGLKFLDRFATKKRKEKVANRMLKRSAS